MRDLSNHIVLSQDYLALTKLWHIMDGLYIWEFVTTFDYEWSVIQGRRPYRWTIWIYSLTRVSSLLTAILNLIGLDAATPINCQAWVSFNFIFGYVALASSSLLVVFRILAICGKNKVVVILAVSVWGINVSCLLQGIIRIRAGWRSVKSACVVLNIETNKPTLIVVLVTDILLLLIMLFGLFNFRRRIGDVSELGRLLWRQGIVWLLIGSIAELTPVLFISLYLRDAVDIMFLIPALLTMSIAATRMYRSLSDRISSTHIVDAFNGLPKGDRATPSTQFSTTILSTSSSRRMEMNMSLPYNTDHHVISFPNRCASVSFLDLGRQERSVQRGPSFGSDLESIGEIDRSTKPLPRIPRNY